MKKQKKSKVTSFRFRHEVQVLIRKEMRRTGKTATRVLEDLVLQGIPFKIS